MGGTSAWNRRAEESQAGPPVFMIVDEVFIAYEVAGAHLRLFTAHVVCLAALALPGSPQPQP